MSEHWIEARDERFDELLHAVLQRSEKWGAGLFAARGIFFLAASMARPRLP